MLRLAIFLHRTLSLSAILLAVQTLYGTRAAPSSIINAVIPENERRLGPKKPEMLDVGEPLTVAPPCTVAYEQCSQSCGPGTQNRLQTCRVGMGVMVTRLGSRDCNQGPCPHRSTPPPSATPMLTLPGVGKLSSRRCLNPGTISHGRRSSSNLLLKQITYTCHEGFSMVGVGYLKCIETDQGWRWSRERPRCYKNGADYERAWQEWSPCSSQCGPGFQRRHTLACTYPTRTKKCREQFRVCNLKPCVTEFTRLLKGSALRRRTGCLAGERFSFFRPREGETCLPWLTNMTDGFENFKVCAFVEPCCRKFNRMQSTLVRRSEKEKNVTYCQRGSFSKTGYSDAKGGCRECPVGSYTACRGQTRCSRCPAGYTTKNTGSYSLQHCEKIEPGRNSQVYDITPSPR